VTIIFIHVDLSTSHAWRRSFSFKSKYQRQPGDNHFTCFHITILLTFSLPIYHISYYLEGQNSDPYIYLSFTMII